MFRNLFKTALRTLAKNKLYSLLNIAGLTFGLTCFLLIGLYLFDELTFDQHHTKGDRIYRLVEHKTVNGEVTTIAAGSFKLAEESRKQIPAVENTTRIQRTGRINILNTENPSNFFQETITVADENFLAIFDFDFIMGDPASALKDPNSIVLTEDLARRLFGKTDVLGKTVMFAAESPLKVSGVIKDHPRNSSFDFTSVMSESSFANSDFYKESASSDWFSENYSVYALLRPKSNTATVSQQMTKLVKDNFSLPAGTNFSYSLQPLKEIHLNSDHIADGARNSNVDPIDKGNSLYIKIFAFVALFILLIAGINYMNLTTAMASTRLKVIGVRKTVGALKGSLIKQFLFESLVITFVSFLFSLLLVNLILPAFNQFSNKDLSLDFATDYRIWLYAIVFAVITGLLSGSYPALMLSRFKPILLLKGSKLQNKTGLSLRKGLVVFQFTISIIMIIATIVLFQQVKFLNNTDIGFDKNLLVIIDVNTGKARSNFEYIKTEMEKIPTVQNVSVTSRVPGEWKTFRIIKVHNAGNTTDAKMSYMFGADKDFLKTYDIKLLKGRNFDTPADSSRVLMNETAAKMLGVTEPAGQKIEIPEVSRGGDGVFRPLTVNNSVYAPSVIGIVRDFHFQSLRDKIEPLIICYNSNPIHSIDYYTAKIDATNIKSSLDKLKAVMVANDPNDPFEYHFLNEQLSRFYIEDERRQTILIAAAIATVFIACLGLFGLATYSAEKRVKEIGVRKVLGATVISLTTLLSRDFLKLVVIATAIAFPVAWWAMNKWLQEYAYHIEIKWWMFALAGAIACIIAMITVSYQAIKAAIANPVESLRTE